MGLNNKVCSSHWGINSLISWFSSSWRSFSRFLYSRFRPHPFSPPLSYIPDGLGVAGTDLSQSGHHPKYQHNKCVALVTETLSSHTTHFPIYSSMKTQPSKAVVPFNALLSEEFICKEECLFRQIQGLCEKKTQLNKSLLTVSMWCCSVHGESLSEFPTCLLSSESPGNSTIVSVSKTSKNKIISSMSCFWYSVKLIRQ